MAIRYRKPRVRVGGASVGAIGVLGEGSLATGDTGHHGPRRIQLRASKRKEFHTPAEKRLEEILNSLGGGVLRGKFYREWAFSRWIVDFFFWENRLCIEVDGPYHRNPNQARRDALKTSDLENAEITLLRLTNEEIFGEREPLVDKLRKAYVAANKRRRRAAQVERVRKRTS